MDSAPRTLLLPALLDAHWPLLRWAFASPDWDPVVLEAREGVEDLGLKYIHNDMCYPCVLIAGQVLSALNSGRYDPARTAVLVGQAGDACRGSCYVRLLRRALDRAGYPQVAVLSLNVRGIDRETGLAITLPMVRRALAAAVWGDALLLLYHQTRPFETVPGAAGDLRAAWIERLSRDLRRGRGLSLPAVVRRCREMAADFRALPTAPRPVRKVAVVGELYMKYCALGNWDLEAFLERRGCQIGVNGLTWYALYYMDTHAMEGPLPARALYRLAEAAGAAVQRRMALALTAQGFETLPPFPDFKRQAAAYAPLSCPAGDGWLITAEAAAWVRAGYRRVLGGQPFGCLPGHVCGRGLYAALQRKLPGTRIVSVDYDASTRDVTVKSRVQMLLDDRDL